MNGFPTAKSEVRLAIEQLKTEHAQLKTRLRELEGQRFLSASDLHRKMELKKQKLKTKDRIAYLSIKIR